VGDIYLDEDEDGTWSTGEQFFSYAAGTNACLTRPAATALPYDWDISSKETVAIAHGGSTMSDAVRLLFYRARLHA